MTEQLPDPVVHYLRTARRVVVLTGGGVAAESQFPSFRDAHTGQWARYDVSELATPQAYQRNPRLVWEWYAFRRRSAETIIPAMTHQALVELEQYYQQFTIITQAIDGLHVRCGSRQVVELNGCLLRTRCFEAGHVVSEWEDVGEVPPRCPHCGSMLRPDVVMFGEGLSQADLRQAREAVQQCDAFIVLGEVGAIEPVSSFPFLARRAHARVITITPDESLYTLLADDVISASPGHMLPALVRAIMHGAA